MELFCNEEHMTCVSNVGESNFGFKVGVAAKGAYYRKFESEIKANCLVFILEGETEITCDNVRKLVKKGEFFFIPISSILETRTIQKVKYVAFSFLYGSIGTCNKHMLSTYQDGIDCSKFEFTSFPIRRPINQFLNLLKDMVNLNINCGHLHELKVQELFILLRGLYTREEIVNIFYPIMGQEGDFRSIILDKHNTITSRHELAAITGMSVSSFSRKFKEEFGEPVYSWMLKQRSKRIYQMLSVPSIPVGDIVKEFDFSSPSHLTKYCRKQFGCTPTELRNRICKKR